MQPSVVRITDSFRAGGKCKREMFGVAVELSCQSTNLTATILRFFTQHFPTQHVFVMIELLEGKWS